MIVIFMEIGKEFTYDLVVFEETEWNNRGYTRVCLYAPDKRPKDECWSTHLHGDSLEYIARNINNYIRENIERGVRHGIKPREFAILNLPENKEAPGYDVRESFMGLADYIGMSPLRHQEFSQLQEIVAKEFPEIWGLPNRSYSDIPIRTQGDALFDDGKMWYDLFEAFKKMSGIDLYATIPPDLKKIIDDYKKAKEEAESLTEKT